MSLLLERSGNEGDRGGRGSSRSHNEPGTDGSDRMSCSSSSSMASSSSEGGGDSAAAADAQGGAIGTSQAAPAASNFSVPPIEDPLSQALTAAVRFQEHLSAGQQHQAEGAAAAAVADAVAVVEGPAPGNNLGSAQQAGLGPPPQPTPPADAYGWRYELLACAVHGCDLATAQELYGTLRTAGVNMGGSPKCRREKHGVLEGAASSQLPDWQAKVEWLESLGFPRVACTHGGRFSLAACCPNLRPRLEWLKARGYSFFAPVASAVAAKGDVDAVLFLLEEGYGHCQMDRTAARHGHLAVLTAMRDAGHVIDAKAAVAAARGGHLHVVQWLAEALGRRAVLTAEVMTVATAAGSKRVRVIGMTGGVVVALLGATLPRVLRVRHILAGRKGPQVGAGAGTREPGKGGRRQGTQLYPARSGTGWAPRSPGGAQVTRGASTSTSELPVYAWRRTTCSEARRRRTPTRCVPVPYPTTSTTGSTRWLVALDDW